MSDERRWPFPRTGPPRKVKDGIRAHSRRGAFGRSWWARRWLAVLEALQVGGRLSRGRAYARRGQVMDVAISEGLVEARVQGSREEPYEVAIRMAPLAPALWQRVARVLSGEAVFLARLLAGEMPDDIEKAFAKAGVSLFPTRLSEIVTRCSCPDWSNPCKHIAAVYYLLGEEFDRDPFLLFALRGSSRDDLLRQVEEAGESARRRKRRKAEAAAGEETPTPLAAASPASFWRPGPLASGVAEESLAPAQAAALLVRLGPFPFWRGTEPLPDALQDVYARAAASALELLAELGPEEGPPPKGE